MCAAPGFVSRVPFTECYFVCRSRNIMSGWIVFVRPRLDWSVFVFLFFGSVLPYFRRLLFRFFFLVAVFSRFCVCAFFFLLSFRSCLENGCARCRVAKHTVRVVCHGRTSATFYFCSRITHDFCLPPRQSVADTAVCSLVPGSFHSYVRSNWQFYSFCYVLKNGPTLIPSGQFVAEKCGAVLEGRG